MNWKPFIPVAKAAGMAVLGALGMVGVQNTVPAVKQATTGPQIIQIAPKCPDIYIDRVKIKR